MKDLKVSQDQHFNYEKFGFRCDDKRMDIDVIRIRDEDHEVKVLRKYYSLEMDQMTDLELIQTKRKNNSSIIDVSMITHCSGDEGRMSLTKVFPHINTKMQVKQLIRSLTGKNTDYFVKMRGEA